MFFKKSTNTIICIGLIHFEISPKSTEMLMDWEEGYWYCQFLECDGFGWRLPNKEELELIYCGSNDFEKEWYWSSNEKETNAGGLDFMDGYFIYHNKNYDKFIRAIRDRL